MLTQARPEVWGDSTQRTVRASNSSGGAGRMGSDAAQQQLLLLCRRLRRRLLGVNHRLREVGEATEVAIGGTKVENLVL